MLWLRIHVYVQTENRQRIKRTVTPRLASYINQADRGVRRSAVFDIDIEGARVRKDLPWIQSWSKSSNSYANEGLTLLD